MTQVEDHCLRRCYCWPVWELGWKCFSPQSRTNFLNENFLRERNLLLVAFAWNLKMFVLEGLLYLGNAFCVYIITFIQLYFLTLVPLLVALTNRWKTPGDVFPISILLHGGWPQGKILMESLSLVIVGRFLFWSYCSGNEMGPEVWYFLAWVLSTIFPNSDHEHLSSL